ncbi:MAG: c-type cytochrome biogenesis protein CcmI [Chromatiaceae bacterium]|nr:c-type cytochrome biogenesis protein CcmI [Chromatiaceae bacterium]
MTIFWILAAGLIGLALLFVLPPLLSKRRQSEGVDQDELNLAVFRQQLQELDSDLAAGELGQQQYRAARRDLERELLYDVGDTGPDNPDDRGGGRWAAALLGVAVPAAAISLYLYLGDSRIIPRLEAAASARAPTAHPSRPGEMPPLEVMVKRLAEKLEQDPNNLKGWMMLGRTYFATGQPERALDALEKAYGLAPENPDVLVAYAEAVAANKGSELAGRPAELIQTALKIDPEHTSARWLEGLASFQSNQFDQAARQWEALVSTFDPDGDEAKELRRYIAEARNRATPSTKQASEATKVADAGGEALNAGKSARTEESAPQQPAASATSVRVEVSLAESLKGQANPSDSLFVYAKAVSGPPMPLAAQRARVQDLPLTLTLDDSMAVIPALKLSGFTEVTVGARISKSRQATPQSGDLEGEVSPVKPSQDGVVTIIINRVRP